MSTGSSGWRRGIANAMQPLHQRSQWMAFTLASACALVVVSLALKVHYVQVPLRSDLRASQVVNHHFVPNWLAAGLEGTGKAWPFALCITALMTAALGLRDRFVALIALVGPPIALLLAEASKPLVARQEGPAFGFPSGHTTAVAAVVTVVAMVIHRRWGARLSSVVAPGLVLVAVAMTITVVRAHDHLMSDAIAGDLLGFGTVLGFAWLLSVTVMRFRRPEEIMVSCRR